MKNGKLKAVRKHKRPSEETHPEAFQKYLDLFYTRPDIPYPTDDDFENFGKSDYFVMKIESTYNPPKFPGGFFCVETNEENLRRAKESMARKRKQQAERRSKILNEDESNVLREKRSMSLTTENELRGAVEEKLRPRAHPLSASTTYLERLKILKEMRKGLYRELDDSPARQPRKDFEFAVEKLERFEAESSPSVYPHNSHVTRNVSRKVIRRLEQIPTNDDYLTKRDVLPVAPDGYIPNSVVVALYAELRRKTEQPIQMYKPIPLNDNQLAELKKYQKVSSLKNKGN